tara:strand:- start:805 stop:993 length:189 start_codon:yes stop_codon:yes gene_type:complete
MMNYARATAQYCVSHGYCSTCDMEGLPNNYIEGGYWKDELSLREYRISAMCQYCQDNYFEEE